MTQYWIAVACREHVKKGIAGGFCQVCHGKSEPLRCMQADDWIIYYSPKECFEGAAPCQKFTAIGQVGAGEPYAFHMSEGFIPWRRQVCFYPSQEIAIAPLIDKLSFIQDKRRWGYPFRRGCFAISFSDFSLIAANMGIHGLF
ncbi:EVE domain-containing protein [Candidatus Protochlamydia phocaeensis]|uniref:EVE domain-containing protein n=1 Tax=Candidatus Protochlamydia phocaeensis TaxID=1414722 RepID=UPI0008392539|nr:EVE domain-containing protein [Candidatus Protochlamydia phocaeensis]